MSTIVTRIGKGSPLTYVEADANFTNLNTDKAERAVANTFTAQQSFTGTAATAPAIAGASDPNTGVFFPAADTVGIATGGAEGLRLNVNRQLGIQTTINSGWGASIPAWQLSTATACYQTSGVSVFANNVYSDGTNARLNTTAAASALVLSGNSANLKNYSSGTAGDVVTVIAAFGLDGSGNAILTTASGGLGYGTGAGGTVTQATSKTTAVTLNKPTGQILTDTAALAAGATVTFRVNNSLVTAIDVVAINVTLNANHMVSVQSTGAGYFDVRLTNFSAGSLSDGVYLQFAIIKGATT